METYWNQNANGGAGAEERISGKNGSVHVASNLPPITTAQQNTLAGGGAGGLTDSVDDIGKEYHNYETKEDIRWEGTVAGFTVTGTGGAVYVISGTGGGASAVTTLETFLIAGGASQTGTAVNYPGGFSTFQATMDGSSGAFAGTVSIMVSNDGSGFIELGTITLSGTAGTVDSDGFASNAPWAYVRADISGFSGTGGTCTVTLGA